MIFFDMDDIEDRCRQLMRLASPKQLNESGTAQEADRWKNLRRKDSKVRVGTAEVARIRDLFPQYRWWLMTGEVMPEVGQVSPGYEEANGKLKQQGQG